MKRNTSKVVLLGAYLLFQGVHIQAMDWSEHGQRRRTEIIIAELSVIAVLEIDVKGANRQDPLYPSVDVSKAQQRLEAMLDQLYGTYSPQEIGAAERERLKRKAEYRSRRQRPKID